MTKKHQADKTLQVLSTGGAPALLYDPILSQPIVAALVRAARAGSTDIEAAASAGIHDRTLSGWKNRGRAAYAAWGGNEKACPLKELPYMRLYAKMTKERALHRIRRREKLEKHGERDWRALAFLEDRDDKIDLLTGRLQPEGDEEFDEAEFEAFVEQTVSVTMKRTTRRRVKAE